jgi:hypothetical protein
MNQFLKSILALGITSALGISAVNAATYQVIDKGDVSSLKYTYSQQENNNGEAAISGTEIYNFPVQFSYLDDDDFDDIVRLADLSHEGVFELEDIEDEDALRAGNPTANDLSWVIRFLKTKASDRLYQKFGDIFAMTNLGTRTELFSVFDEKFSNENNSKTVDTDAFTRSTTDYISGITDEGWVYGNASAPYLPYDYTVTNSFDNHDVGDVIQNWRREFTTRGFFSPDGGTTIIEILPPSETKDYRAPYNLW